MWCFTLLLLVGAVVAYDHEHAWETGKQYQYLVRSRTLSAIDKLNDQSSGIAFRATLTIQVISPDKLQAMLTMPEFARIHTQLPEGLDKHMSDQQLQYEEFPLSGKSFEIIVKHGMIRDLMVHKNVPTWELNLLKGIVSQLQVDTLGENTLHDHSTQEPRDGQLFASYKTMEDTVGGKCEVLYDISPLSMENLYNSPELAPLANEKEDKIHHHQLIEIRKTKNYNNCRQQRGYHLGKSGRMSLTQGSNNNKDRTTTRSSDSRIILSGDLKRFCIQSSVTTNNIFVRAVDTTDDNFIGTVHSKMNLTLVNKDKISKDLSINHENLVSTGNLLYTYNNPLTEIQQGRQYKETISRNSQEVQSSESSSENNEKHKRGEGKNWFKHQGGSSSSSSSSSAVSSSEEFEFLQNLPSMKEAPKSMTPFSLAFQDNQVPSDVVQKAVQHANQIINDLHQTNDVISKYTLEKFTNFVNLLRVMNNDQINDVETQLQNVQGNQPHNLSDDNASQTDAWNIIRDGVAHAGTAPALLTVIRWIQEGKLKGIEGARVISKIPKNVRVPSENYIETVFQNIVANPKVQQLEFMNKITPIAFSELVRDAQVDKRHSQNSYPIYNFGKLNPESDKAVAENYIPYMEKQLQQSIKNGDNPQAQAYIVALGNFGHSKALRVFEPFLEGQQQVSTYLRTLMVSSLRSLVRRFPAVVAPVLYKIYLNEQEAHEVRCAAVHLYFLTDPPLVSMLRMAKYTNYDKSDEVNAAVKSSIISLSKWKRFEFYHLSQKARAAKKLLTPNEFSNTNSRGIYKQYNIVQIIGSEDSNVPKNLYANALRSFGKTAETVAEMEYGVSSVRRLIDMFEKPETNQENAWLDDIRQSLSMQPRQVEQVEGSFRSSNIYETIFHPFDQQGVQQYVSYLKENWNNGGQIQSNRLDNYDEMVSFPTESGLPFTYSIEIPTLTRVSISKQPATGGGKPTSEANGIVNVLCANTMQTRFGVVVSHEHLLYAAGVDKNVYGYLPVEYNFNLESNEPAHNLELKVRVDQKDQSSPLKLAYRTVVPFTAQIDMKNLVPVAQGQMQRVLRSNRQTKSVIRIGSLQVAYEADNEPDTTPENTWQWLSSLFDQSIHYRKIELSSVSEPGTDARREEAILNVAYDELNTNDNDNNGQQNGQNELEHNSIDVNDKQPNSAARRKQFLQEVTKGLNSANAYVTDVAVQIPFLQNRQVLTVSVGYSNVERKIQYIAYWNRQSKTGEVITEALVTGMVQNSQDNFLSYDKAIHQLPIDQFKATLRVGKNYNQAEKVEIEGRLLRSESLSEMVMKSKIAQQCMNEMRLGKGLKTCQKAIDLALEKNLLQMLIKTDSDDFNEIITILTGYITQNLPGANVDVTNEENPDLKNKINVEVKLSPNFENTEATLTTSQMNVKLQLQGENQMEQQNVNEKENEETEASCTASTNEVVTFDQKNYPLNMGGVWHVMLISDQLEVLEFPKIESVSQPASVEIREQDNRLQVRVLAGNKKYHLQQSGDHLQALINGQEVKLTKQEKYQDKEQGEIVAELYLQQDGSMVLDLMNNKINILYDGKHVQLQVSGKYRNAIRGLCGNYDKQANNDFLTPQNCILQKPEEFSATYALFNRETQDVNAKKLIEKNKERANHAVCTPIISHQTNVINDREAGRLAEPQLYWGYHLNRNQNRNQGNIRLIHRTQVDETDDEICFSVRPLPACSENSRPAETKQKSVPMHCMPKTEAAQEMKRRVQQGANPDLSHKSVSKKQIFELPVACY